MTQLLQAALGYARRGWYVFPVTTPIVGIKNSGKRPHWLAVNGKLDATLDANIIASWWGQDPNASIGIDTARSQLVVLDVDIGEGKVGRESLATIDHELTPTLTARTGGGGLHAFYLRPLDLDPAQGLGALPNLDLIGNGYVVAAPSPHWTGGVYSWVNDSPIAELPPVLRTLRKPTIAPTVAALGQAPIPEGGRNNALFKLGAALRATGIDHDALRAALTFENARRFTPPLPDDEVDLVARSVMNRVHPERDVAAGAVLDTELRAMFPQQAEPHGTVYTANELVDSLLEQAKLPVVPLPFAKLNDKIGGLSIHSSTLIVAGTGKGKSSFAGQLAAWHAATQGPAVIYVGEMTPELYLGRIAGQLLGCSWIDVTRGKLTAAKIKRALADRPLYLVRRNDNPVRSMLEACSRAHNDGHTGVPMVVVDYMQLLAHASADMRTSTMQAVRDVRAMLEDTDMVGLLISQTSRGNAKRIREGGGNAEDLGDVGAETAELEQSATNQFVLSFVSKDNAEVHEVALAVTKSRFGGGAKFGFTFNGKTGLWASTDRPPANAAHEALCEAILGQLGIHRDKVCVGGGGSCGKEFTTRSLCDRGPHKVTGRAESIREAVQDLIALRKVAKQGNLLMLSE